MDSRSTEEVRQKVIELVEEVSDDDTVVDHPDDDLFETDVLDSMGAIELLVDLEDELGVSIAPTELPRSEMNTLNKIIARVLERV